MCCHVGEGHVARNEGRPLANIQQGAEPLGPRALEERVLPVEAGVSWRGVPQTSPQPHRRCLELGRVRQQEITLSCSQTPELRRLGHHELAQSTQCGAHLLRSNS